MQALREDAAKLGVWLLIGSLGLKTDDPDGRFANRSFLIAPDGAIVARYDKIHMFDVADHRKPKPIANRPVTVPGIARFWQIRRWAGSA